MRAGRRFTSLAAEVARPSGVDAKPSGLSGKGSAARWLRCRWLEPSIPRGGPLAISTSFCRFGVLLITASRMGEPMPRLEIAQHMKVCSTREKGRAFYPALVEFARSSGGKDLVVSFR